MATSDTGETGHGCVCIVAYTAYVAYVVASMRTRVCSRVGSVGEYAANTANHRPSGVDTNKIRHVRDNERLLIYQQLGIRIVDIFQTVQTVEKRNFILNT